MASPGPEPPPPPDTLPSTGPFLPPRPPRVRSKGFALAGLLLLVTLLTTTTLGAVWIRALDPSATEAAALPVLTPGSVLAVWGDAGTLATGLAFACPTLLILLCHELGHYAVCRGYGIRSTPPYFLPLPVGLGTAGAFLRIRSPIRSRRELFDIGVSGPIAGFLALVPILVYGIARSRLIELTEGAQPLLRHGDCLATWLATRWFHGPLPEGTVLEYHPFALAAWFGLLATGLNLLPLAQLDGGHVLYAVAGRWQHRLALPLWGLLGLTGLLWRGWWLWCGIVLLIGLFHPPVRDERQPLGGRRWVLAWAALVVFALSFIPIPIALGESIGGG